LKTNLLFLTGCQFIVMLGLAGCVDHSVRPVSSPAPVPTPAPTTTQPTLPPTLTDAEIANTINSALDLIQMRRTSIACTGGARRSPASTGGGSLIGSVLMPTGPSGYAVWLDYLASHIQSDTPFGQDYDDIASGALDVSGWTDVSGDTCLNSHTTDVNLMRDWHGRPQPDRSDSTE
jgi:hypothetical protein